MSRQRFRDLWKNQTELGRRFALSAVEVGRLLIENGLKDPKTKQATPKAVQEGYATFTPLKDGTPFHLWNVQKIGALLSRTHEPLSPVDFHAYEAIKSMREADRLLETGQDKLAYLMMDTLFDDIPGHLRTEVEKRAKALYEHGRHE